MDSCTGMRASGRVATCQSARRAPRADTAVEGWDGGRFLKILNQIMDF